MKNLFFFLMIGLLLSACGSGGNSNTSAGANVQGLDLTGFTIVDLTNGYQHVSRADASGKILEEGTIKNGKRNGTWVTYNPSRNLPQTMANFVEDVYNGVYMEYSNAGQMELVCHYKNNVLHGEFMRIKNTRTQERGTYVEGKLEGVFQKFYDNTNKLKQENHYKNGELHGPSKYFNEQGELSFEYEYKNGERIGGGEDL